MLHVPLVPWCLLALRAGSGKHQQLWVKDALASNVQGKPSRQLACAMQVLDSTFLSLWRNFNLLVKLPEVQGPWGSSAKGY